MSKYKWLMFDGERLYDVGILADGSLHNPRGYPDDDVRAAVLAADNRRHDRRSIAATRAAETRRRRTEKRVYETAKRIVEGHKLGSRRRCVICGRGLDDPQSIGRGIGSECWQAVLGAVQAQKAAA